MPSHIDSNRIARNSIVLYFRTFIVLIVSLITSRVILRALGVDDYGIYQVVGGVVAMFSLLSSALSAAISRFITFEIGRGDRDKLRTIFASSNLIQIAIAAIAALLAEAVGIWFLQTQMQIPAGRESAAMIAFQCSLFTFCVNLVSVPYNACIIAHEHMRTYAYISILDAFAKLGICYLVAVSPIDKLDTYALALALEALLVRIIYITYCRRHFEESKAGIKFDKPVFREIASFAGWNFMTNSVSIFNNHGVTMLVNVFFGVAINAARGLALQVESAVMQFVGSFTTAINPQITKSYAAGDRQGMFKLVCRGAKFSYLSMLVLSVPLMFEADYVLRLWLGNPPALTADFVRLSLALGMIDCIGMSSYTALLATGKMRTYALIITPLGILAFPLAWAAFALGAPVIAAYYIYIGVKLIVLMARIYLMKRLICFNPWVYVKEVIVASLLATAVAIIPPFLIVHFFDQGLLRLIVSIAVGGGSVCLSALFIGMRADERRAVVNLALSMTKKLTKRDKQ